MSEATKVPMICDGCGGTLADDDAIWSSSLGIFSHINFSQCISSLGERLALATKRAEAAEAEAERDALRKDAARLDWLESRSSFLVHQWQGGGYTLTLPQPPIDGVRPPPIGVAGDAFRQAIDAAMAVQP